MLTSLFLGKHFDLFTWGVYPCGVVVSMMAIGAMGVQAWRVWESRSALRRTAAPSKAN